MVRVCPCRLMEITSLDQVCRGAAAVAVGVSGTAVSGALPPGRRRPRGDSRCPPRWCPAPCTGSPQTPGPPSRRSGSTLRDMKDKRSVSGQDTTRSCASWEFDSWNWTGTLYPISDYDALRRAHTHTHTCAIFILKIITWVNHTRSPMPLCTWTWFRLAQEKQSVWMVVSGFDVTHAHHSETRLYT